MAKAKKTQNQIASREEPAIIDWCMSMLKEEMSCQGSVVNAVVTYAAPYHLLADTFISHRRPDARKGISSTSGLVQIA